MLSSSRFLLPANSFYFIFVCVNIYIYISSKNWVSLVQFVLFFSTKSQLWILNLRALSDRVWRETLMVLMWGNGFILYQCPVVPWPREVDPSRAAVTCRKLFANIRNMRNRSCVFHVMWLFVIYLISIKVMFESN